jgi:hypothetical protein
MVRQSNRGFFLFSSFFFFSCSYLVSAGFAEHTVLGRALMCHASLSQLLKSDAQQSQKFLTI